MKRNWKEKYWDFIISNRIEKAIPLKESNFPKSFFKYKSLSDRTIQGLVENYVWVSEIEKLNDPFECSIQFDNDECLRLFYSSEQFKTTFEKATGKNLTNQEIEILKSSQKPHDEYLKICKANNIFYKLTSEEQLRITTKRWANMVEETNRNLKICSFSLISDSLLLWSHYSDEHKGICIEYDFSEDDCIRPFIQPIIYRNKVHKIDIFDDYSLMQMIGSSLIKSEGWKYEEEWRLTIFKQKENFPNKIPAPKPKAIYLGTRFKLNKIELKIDLMKYAIENKIPLYNMTKHSNEFKVVKGILYNP